MVEVGMVGRADSVVVLENTAKRVGSGSLEVLATPMMIALMEKAAVQALSLAKEQTSVGTYLDVKHLAATPLGMNIWAVAKVIESEGRKIVFEVEAFDEKEKIGEGRHERVVVTSDKFLQKTNAKRGDQ